MCNQILVITWIHRFGLRISSWFRRNVGLRTKMGVIVIIGIVSFTALATYLSTTALQGNIHNTLQERTLLAQTAARHIDYLIATIQNVLTDVVAVEDWSNPVNVDLALDRAYRRLDFYSTQVFLIDRTGHALATRPPITSNVDFNNYASVAAVLSGQPFAVSRYNRLLDSIGFSTIASSPVRDPSGNIIGALVISIDLFEPNIRIFTEPIGLGETGYMDLVDLGGTILASTRTNRVGLESDHSESLQGMIRDHQQAISMCYDCTTSGSGPQTRKVLAFAPLDGAQWGVAIYQREDEVFGPTRLLQVRIFALMVIMLTGALTLVYLSTRSVIRPVKALTVAAQRIATGDLNTPLEIHGHGEVNTLARSFDTMREQLKDTMAEIQAWNRDLDARVQEKTAAYENALHDNSLLLEELQHKERLRSMLLHRVISAQEEERVRISHELHDETCQMLTALAYILDNVEDEANSAEMFKSLEQMHSMTERIQEELHRIIMDLRPTMLDHLGLVPALRWYADSRFSSPGIVSNIRVVGRVRRLLPDIEITLFRVVQEAINNIARHSKAQHSNLVFEFFTDRVEVRISDDGEGFDLARIETKPEENRGLGLMGMSERMSTIGGEFHLQSMPGKGTVISLAVNLGRLDNDKDSSIGG